MINRKEACPICTSPASKVDDVVPSYSCVRCGDYRIDGARWNHGKLDRKKFVVLSGWIKEQNAAGVTPAITQEIFLSVTSRAAPRIKARAFEALKVFGKQYPGLDHWITFDDSNEYEMLALSYSAEQSDLDVLLELLHLWQFLRQDHGAYSLSPLGIVKLEELTVTGNSSAIGFVAMSFDATMNDAWTIGFEPAIHAAGFTALRISDKEYVGGITDEIIAEIRGARFVVADYTGQKAGVYFEAGFALGLGLTVVPTCHADEINKLHFDIRHLNTLVWSDPEELADKLAKRIKAVVGIGPNAV